jgi:type IV fimbrial biogenesis protein FimT
MRERNRGVAACLIAVLLTIGVPSFSNLISDTRLNGSSDEFQVMLNYAKAEAIRRNRPVTVTATAGGNQWASGVRVWFDTNGNGNYNNGEELRVLQAMPATITISGNPNISAFNYTSTGGVGAAVTFSVCDNRTGETGVSIEVLQSGFVRSAGMVCP